VVQALVLEIPTNYDTAVVNQDGLWKKVIGELFEDFLLFFAPELYSEVDLSKAPDILQQELFQEIANRKKGTNYADQIVKVHLRDGEEKWILVHIEVEGSLDADFSERMFRYFYRIYDKYERKIVAFAVKTSPGGSEKSPAFNYSYFGTTLDYAYNTYHVSDYDEDELAQSDRLFSKIVLAAKYMHETKHQMDERYWFKMKLMREILKMDNHSRKSVRAVFYFIDYLLELPKDMTKYLVETMRPILREEGNRMIQSEREDLSPTLAELIAFERGEGEERGKQVERKNLALSLLRDDFEVAYIAKLTKLSVAEVEELKASLT